MPPPTEAASADPLPERYAFRNPELVSLYTRYCAELCRYVRKKFGAEEAHSQDIVHQSFMRYAAISNSDAIRNVRAYLYRTVRNIVSDERRRSISRKSVVATLSQCDTCVDDLTPERVLIGQERLNLLRAVIRAEPEARRRSFLLNRLDGLSCAEIARRTGYSESAIKKHIALVMADLDAAVTRAEARNPGS